MATPPFHRKVVNRTSRQLAVTALSVFLLLSAGCNSGDGPVGNNPPDNNPPVKLVIPLSFPTGVTIPFAVLDTTVNPRKSQRLPLALSTSPPSIQETELTMKRGRVAGSVEFTTAGEINVTVSSALGTALAHQKVNAQEDTSHREMSGILTGNNLLWNSSYLIIIDENVTIPAGEQLVVGAGTVVLLSGNVRIEVFGSMDIQGTSEAPVTFTAQSTTEPWGEIDVHNGGTLSMKWAMLTRGGGDESRAFGHSGSQPVVRGDHAILEFDHCVLVDNPGKAIGSQYSTVVLDASLIAQCDTGGEHFFSVVTAENTWFLNMPSLSPDPAEDDNDGIYLNDPNPGEVPSLLRNCVFVTGMDDAIDHNGAMVNVENCVIEDFYHEGVAASDKNWIHVSNTLILDCEQGIEAGYGSPEVTVDHCVLTGNDIGLRFGDNYPFYTHEGTLTAVNTISTENRLHNVWNYDPTSQQPVEGKIQITYSIVNDADYDSGVGNLQGEVHFSEEYLLMEGSIGRGAAEDGTDMGLLP